MVASAEQDLGFGRSERGDGRGYEVQLMDGFGV
jgi:hypothetical protein